MLLETRSRLFHLFFTIVVLFASSVASSATPYPSKPVHLLVPFSSGGGSDIVARQIAVRLSERLKQPVLVENKPSNAGILATEIVAKADPDGHTLLIAMSTQATFPSLYPHLSFDAVKSFSPITLIGTSPLVAVINSSFPANSVQSFIAYAKANPEKTNFGSSGTGSPIHLAGEMFKTTANLKMVHIPYKGIAPAITALMANEIQILFPAVFLAQPHVKSGRLSVLGVAALKRSSLVPDWPTLAESGLTNFEANIWYGVMAPAKTDPATISLLHKEITSIIQQPEVKQFFLSQGIEVLGSTPKEFADVLDEDVKRLGKLIEENGIKAD